jgi:hypothetical protein
MDQTRAREMGRDAAEQLGKTAKLANQASEAGKQAVGRAGELIGRRTTGQTDGEQSLRPGFSVSRARTPRRDVPA